MPFINRTSKDLLTTGRKVNYFVDWTLANPDGLDGRLQSITVKGDGTTVYAGNPTYGVSPNAGRGRMYPIINGSFQAGTGPTGAAANHREGQSVAVLDDSQSTDGWYYVAHSRPGAGTNASGEVRVDNYVGEFANVQTITNPDTSGTSGYDYSTDTAGVPDGFGTYIMMFDGSGDVGGQLELFIAAPFYGDATTGAVGRIYHYRRTANTFSALWTLLATIDGPANPSYITGTKRLGRGSWGHSMAIQWGFEAGFDFTYQLAVGDPYQGDDDNRGRISLHRFDVSASSWSEVLVQEGTQSNGYWGWAMDLKFGVFAVSSPAITGTGRTEFVRAWSFDLLYNGTNPTGYIQIEKSDLGVSPTLNDQGWFGHSLAIDSRDSDVLYIGSPTYDPPIQPNSTVSEGMGRVYVVNPFTRELRLIIEALDAVNGISNDDRFGYDIAVPNRNPFLSYSNDNPPQLVVLAEKGDKGTGPTLGSVGRIYNMYIRY